MCENLVMCACVPQFLNDVNTEPHKHLSYRGDLTLEEDGNRPIAIRSHLVEEPTARNHRAVKLLREELNPLNNVQFLLCMNKRFKKKGR